MKYKIENTHKIACLTQRGFTCDYGGTNLEGYWFKFINRDQTEWGIELGNEVTDDGFITYCVFYRDVATRRYVHTAMILLRDITNPDHAMDLFTQLLDNQKQNLNMEKIYKCPKCGEKENLHFNYDYSMQHRPIKDVLCNECGEVFEGNMPVDVFIAKATFEYPELEGTMGLCEDIIKKRTGKMTEEEWQAAERAQTSSQTETTADYIDRHIIQSMLEFAREINSVSDEVILQTAQEKSDMFVKWHEHSTEFGHLAYVRGFVDAIEWYRDKLKNRKMKLTIKNLDKFNNYADVWFKANSSINRTHVVSELRDKYIFHFELYGMSFDIHLLRTQDFMPGWPVEVWAFNEKLKKWSKVGETNARENQITSKADWSIYVKDAIEWAWNNNHKNLR